VTSVLK